MRRSPGARSAILGVLVTSVCLVVLLGRVDLVETRSALGRLDGRLLVVPLLVSLGNIVLRALRWRAIFPAAARPTTGACFSALVIGNMTNFLLPGRAGDLARCVLVDRAVSVSAASRGFATLVVEKVFDGLGLAGMVMLAAWALVLPRWVTGLLTVAVLVFGGALLAVAALRFRTADLVAAVRGAFRVARLPGAGARLEEPLRSFSEGLAAVSSASAMVTVAALSGAILATEAALVWALALAFGLVLPAKSAVVVAAVLGLGLMVPAAPGGLGTYELAGVAALELVSVESGTALALTLAIHAWVFVTNTVLGLVFLVASGVKPAQLWGTSRTTGPRP